MISAASRTTASNISTDSPRVSRSPSRPSRGRREGLLHLWGMTGADPCAGLGGGRRLSPVELRLPELPRRAGRHASRDRTLAGVCGGRRPRGGVLRLVELLSGNSRAGGGLPRPASTRAAPLADRRNRVDER